MNSANSLCTSRHVSSHPRTAILMGHARGIALLAAAEAGVPLVSYSATHIKKSLVGAGHASKEQVQRAIQSFFNLKTAPQPPDVADALAVALCHAHRAVRTARGNLGIGAAGRETRRARSL